jgi:hypothetical protein
VRTDGGPPMLGCPPIIPGGLGPGGRGGAAAALAPGGPPIDAGRCQFVM